MTRFPATITRRGRPDFRDGSIASIPRCAQGVRLTPDSEHAATTAAGPFRAMNVLVRCSAVAAKWKRRRAGRRVRDEERTHSLYMEPAGTTRSQSRVLTMPQSSQSAEQARWISSVCQRLVAQAGRIGAAPTDSTERALQKRLVVSLSVGLLPLTFLWSVVYFAAGAPLSAAVPGLYTVIAPINTAVFAWTRNLVFYRFIQLLMFLILPWLLMMSLGGSRTRAW